MTTNLNAEAAADAVRVGVGVGGSQLVGNIGYRDEMSEEFSNLSPPFLSVSQTIMVAGVDHVCSIILVIREQLLELEDRHGGTLRKDIGTKQKQH